jgi:hypothetical protein
VGGVFISKMRRKYPANSSTLQAEFSPYEQHGSLNDHTAQLGDDIDGEAAFDRSGESVALSDDGMIVAVGAPYNDGNGSNSGHVRVFEWDDTDTAWNQLSS